MATKQVTARIEEELETKVRNIIEEQKRNIMGGEINLATVIRYSLEQYVKEYEEKKKGIVTLKFDMRNMTDNELKAVKEFAVVLAKEFKHDEALNSGEYDKIPPEYKYGVLQPLAMSELLKRELRK